MAPPIESASMSGVGAFVTSMDSIFASEACSNSNARPVLADWALATRWPSIVTEFNSELAPRIDTVPLLSMVTLGMLRSS